MKSTIYGISGCTNAGKTTLSTKLIEKIKDKGLNIEYICQDDYFKIKENVRKILSNKDDKLYHYHYDEIESVDEDLMIKDIELKSINNDLLIIEGNMLCESKKLIKLMDNVVFITLTEDECKKRRKTRIYDPPDTPHYFDDIVWPSYINHLNNAEELMENNILDVKFLSGNESIDMIEHKIYKHFESSIKYLIRIQHHLLDSKLAENFVILPECGAVSTFIGTTRNNFNNKEVLSLEYECYESMAYSELKNVCKETINKYQNVKRIAIFHRIGNVKIGEASVIISTSSPHRKDAILATSYAIDILKSRVPIFKKEIYSDGTTSWKENCEFHQLEDDLNHGDNDHYC